MSCPDCFKGSVHDHDTAKGRMEMIHGYQTYVAEGHSNKTSESTILFLTDAFGLRLINNKLLADRYAKDTGCRVLVPDIIPGGGVTPALLPVMDIVLRPAGYNPFAWLNRIFNGIKAVLYFIPFIVKANPSKVFPDILRYARDIRTDLPQGGKLGVCGFCWGGYGSTSLCAETATPGGSEKLIDAQFCAHPSAIKGPDMVVDAVTKLNVPYSCAVAEKDFQFSASVAENVEALLRQKVGPPHENNYEFVIHKDCTHSFAVRANPEIKAEFQGLEDAAKQATDWFNKYLN